MLMKKSRPLLLLALLVLASFCLSGEMLLQAQEQASPQKTGAAPSIALTAASAPLAMPHAGKADFRFEFLSPWQAVQIPVATRFDPPVGSENSALIYNAQRFWEMNSNRGGHHTGDDLNGIGGMNTDLGDPVYATGDGVVIFAGNPAEGWGNIIIVAHRTSAGEILHTMYAHLDSMQIQLGQLVYRGQKIATVGTANGHYPAHLHFEMRASDCIDIGGGYSKNFLNRIDPLDAILLLRNAPLERLSASPLSLVFPEDKSSR